MKMKYWNPTSLRPNYFIFIGYLKTGGGEGGSNEPPEPPLDPPLVLRVGLSSVFIALLVIFTGFWIKISNYTVQF